MGTFLRQIGEVYISDSQRAAYSQRLLLLLREGGMMRYESVEIWYCGLNQRFLRNKLLDCQNMQQILICSKVLN